MRLTDPKHNANKLINGVQKGFDDFVLMNGKNMSAYSALNVRDHLLGRSSNYHPKDQTALEYIEKYYTSTIEKNANLSIGTKKNHVKANRLLKNFLTQKKKQHLLVKELNSSIATEFKDYLLYSIDDEERTGMSEASALGNIKKVSHHL